MMTDNVVEVALKLLDKPVREGLDASKRHQAQMKTEYERNGK